MTIQETLAETRKTLQVMKLLARIQQPVIAPRKVPIPGHGGRPSKYPWATLRVDDSFLVPCADNPTARQRVMNSMTSCIANVRYRYGRNFVQRVDRDGVRVWRVE